MSLDQDRPEGFRRVAAALAERGHAHAPVWLDVAARTSQEAPLTLIDRELFRFTEMWAAAGHPNGVFKLAQAELASLTGALVADVAEA